MWNCDLDTLRKCKNNALCNWCESQSLLKLPQNRLQNASQSSTLKKKKMSKKGEKFEKAITKTWNTSQDTDIILDEYKLHVINSVVFVNTIVNQAITTRGAKSVTFKLNDLTALANTAATNGYSYWYQAFKFSGNDTCYVVTAFDNLLYVLSVLQALDADYALGQAMLQPNSGALYHMPGDITTSDALLECKERNTMSGTNEAFVLQLSWLDKIQGEARRANKPYWYLPFTFGNHGTFFVVTSTQHMLTLLQTIEKFG